MDHKKLIANSVDARCMKWNMKLYLVAFMVLMIFTSLVAIICFYDQPEHIATPLFLYALLFSIAYIPPAIYNLLKLRRLTKRCHTYIFSNTRLVNYENTGWGHLSFLVEITDQNGEKVTRNTDSIYLMRGSISRFDEWHNQRVQIAYDPGTEKVIVCRRL